MNKRLVFEASNDIKQEAKEVLHLTNIETVLEDFGEVNLIGSYKYNVMVARDVDFHVIIGEFNPEIPKIFFRRMVNTSLFEYISFHDKHAFNKEAAARYASKKALESYYFGLRLTHNTHEWQIDVNFITEPQAVSQEIVRLFENVTDTQRAQILQFKRMLQEMGAKVSSTYVYRAVLEKNAKNKNELFACLKTIGYDLGS